MKLDRQRIGGSAPLRRWAFAHPRSGASMMFAGFILFGGLPLPLKAGANDSTDDQVIVAFSTVVASQGKFVLLNRQQHFAAVRFLDVKHGNDSATPNVFHSGEATESATYECYYRDDGIKTFTSGKYTHFVRALSSGPIRGIGRLAVRTGHYEMNCGSFKLPWFAPTSLGFERKMTLKAADGTEMAPTAIADVRRIDGNLPCAVWYRHTADKPLIKLRLDQLCQ